MSAPRAEQINRRHTDATCSFQQLVEVRWNRRGDQVDLVPVRDDVAVSVPVLATNCTFNLHGRAAGDCGSVAVVQGKLAAMKSLSCLLWTSDRLAGAEREAARE